MKGRRAIAVALSVVLWSGSVAQEEMKFVSLIQLIATPERYDGQRVRVIGLVSYRFESQALYPSKEDYRLVNQASAIWLAVDPDDRLRDERARRLHGKYAEVVGVFDASHRGHMSLYSGTIRVESISKERRHR